MSLPPISKTALNGWASSLAPRHITMPPKRRLNKGEKTASAEKTPKRVKLDTPAARLVDGMEERMKGINESLPPEYQIDPGIFEIPRDLLKSGTSAETMSTRLATFKNFCQSRLDTISIKLG